MHARSEYIYTCCGDYIRKGNNGLQGEQISKCVLDEMGYGNAIAERFVRELIVCNEIVRRCGERERDEMREMSLCLRGSECMWI